MTATSPASTEAPAKPVQPSNSNASPVAWKHLLWRDAKVFGPPALVFIAGFVLMTLLAYLFANEKQFAEIASGIMFFTGHGLAVIWATAAGSIITAGDRENGTDVWIGSLPIPPWKVLLVRLATAYASVVTVCVVASTAIFWGEFHGEDLRPFLWQSLLVAALFLTTGLAAGAITGNVMAGLALGGIVPVAGFVLLIVTVDTFAVSESKHTAITVVAFALIAAASLAYASWAYTNQRYPTWSPSNHASRGSLRRKIADLVSPTRETRSLVARELRTVAIFLPIAFAVLLVALVLTRAPIAWYSVVALIPLTAGLVLAHADGRNDSLGFLTDRGRSGFLVWLVKNTVWIGSVGTLLTAFLYTQETVMVSTSQRPANQRSWQINADQLTTHNVPPSSAISTLYASSETRLTGLKVASPTTRIIQTAVALGLTLFLIGQIFGFWLRRKVIAITLTFVAGLLWFYLHSLTAAFETPSWAVNGVPLIILTVFAARAGIDAVYQRTPVLRRVIAATLMVLLFVGSVRTARIASIPSRAPTTQADKRINPTPPSAETIRLLDEISQAYTVNLLVPPVAKRGFVEPNVVELKSESNADENAIANPRQQAVDAVERTVGWVERLQLAEFNAASDVAPFPEDPRPEGDNASESIEQKESRYWREVNQAFNERVTLTRSFAEKIVHHQDMPAGQTFPSQSIVEQLTTVLLIEALSKFESNPDDAWKSWKAAWIICEYFGRHDGEWTTHHSESPVSPASLDALNRSRGLILHVLETQQSQTPLSEARERDLFSFLHTYQPKPAQELADAAYRVLISPVFGRKEETTDIGTELIDGYLGIRSCVLRSNLTGVKILQYYANVNDNLYARITLEDTARSLGLTERDLRIIESMNAYSGLVGDTKTIKPFFDHLRSMRQSSPTWPAAGILPRFERVLVTLSTPDSQRTDTDGPMPTEPQNDLSPFSIPEIDVNAPSGIQLEINDNPPTIE